MPLSYHLPEMVWVRNYDMRLVYQKVTVITRVRYTLRLNKTLLFTAYCRRKVRPTTVLHVTSNYQLKCKYLAHESFISYKL